MLKSTISESSSCHYENADSVYSLSFNLALKIYRPTFRDMIIEACKAKQCFSKALSS